MIRYIVITPARDEEEFLEKTIACMAKQTILPQQWIIVDDGSLDRTAAIIDASAEKYPWITPVHRSNRGYREAGGGVIAAFYAGFERIESSTWDFLVKFDADLSFSPDYFEKCFAEFDRDPKLGIAGGGIYHEAGSELKLEDAPAFHVRGATKIYRRACWEAIEGLVRAPGWDTLDELKANMLGWTSRTFRELRLCHHRFTGAAAGAWKDSIKNGRANYITGYHPLFMLLKCIRRTGQRPYVTGSIGLGWGYISGYFKRIPMVQDRQLIEYTRAQQLRKLFMMETIWK